MSDTNKIFLTGRLGDDPSLKYTPAGKAIANFDIAVNDGFGENKKTFWIKIIVWEKQAENCANYLKKGMQCLIEGKLSIREWETSDGQKRKATEVVANRVQFLERATSNKPPQQESAQSHDDDISGIDLNSLPF
jgi:single-strand DNA-binding protein